jgi:hypothetical protein
MYSWVLVAHFAYERSITPVNPHNPFLFRVLDFQTAQSRFYAMHHDAPMLADVVQSLSVQVFACNCLSGP